MPIRAADGSGGYQSVPVQDEDVTPIDHSIAKRAQTSFNYFVGASLLIIIAVVAVVLWYHHDNSAQVSVYQTTPRSLSMKQVLPQDVRAAPGVEVATLSFGNTQCEPGADIGEILCINMDSSPSIITIDESSTYQSILGFGGAFTEASAVNFYKLPVEVQKKFMALYFGKDGIGYTLGRIHINSCDFSLESYNFDNVSNDYDLTHFDTEVTHDQIAILPFIRLAMETSSAPIRLLASPWSPPAWMKNPDAEGKQEMTGSALPNGLRNDIKTKIAWARYISKFISAYSAQGVPVWSVTPQNEPEFPAPWEACAYNASFENDFIQNYLGPVLRAEHPGVLILGFDHNKDHLVAWAKTLMARGTEKYIDGMAFHWYSGGARVEDGTYGYDALNTTHHLSPGSVLLASEGCSCPGVEVGNWLRAERLGHDVMFDLLNHAQGWIDWNLLVDHEGGPNHLGNNCDAALVTDESFEDLIVQPKFHYMAHFSKFIPPGAVRISSTAVGNFEYETMDPNIQAGAELGMFPCERSVRQMWRLVAPIFGQLAEMSTASYAVQLSTPALTMDQTYPGKVQLCVARSSKALRSALRIADCTDASADLLRVSQNALGQLVDANSTLCLSFWGDVREAGALLELAPCLSVKEFIDGHKVARAAHHQLFAHDVSTGVITAPKVDRALCLTAGWPFFNTVAFQYLDPTDHKGVRMKNSVVVMNEAAVGTSLVLWDKLKNAYLGLAVEARAIQTIVF